MADTHELTTSVFPGPVTANTYVFGAGTGQADANPDVIPTPLIYDYVKTLTDTVYPTIQQLSSVSDVANNALNQAAGVWQGEGLQTDGFAATTNPTGLVTYQQMVASAGGVIDGDKGDIIVSLGMWTVDADVVSNAKLADMPTATFKGRTTAATGDPEDLTVAQAKTLLNLTGTNSGDQTSIVGISGTKAQFDTAVTDGNFMYIGDAPTAHTQLLSTISDVTMTAANLNSLDDGVDSTLHFHSADRARANHTGTQLSTTVSDFNEAAQDAIGAMVDASLTYNDATPSLSRAALTGAVTASAGSNATALGSFTTAQLNTALSDNDVATGGGTATGTNTGDVTLAGAPTYLTIAGQVITRALIDLASHITGRLPFTNLTQVTARSVLGVAGNALADAASIQGTTDQVFRVDTAGTGLGFGTVATAGITNSAVTLAKMADVATASVFYRKTAAVGVPEVQTLATLKTDLGLTGTNSGDQTSIVGITGTIAQFNTAITDGDLATGGGTATGANTADVTLAGTPTYLTIAGQVITRAFVALTSDVTGRLQPSNFVQGSARSVLGVTGNVTADAASIQGTADQVLRVDTAGTALGFGAIATAGITNAAVTLAKMADVATATVFYRKTAATGVPEVQTLATLKTDLGLTGTNSGDQTSIVGITGTIAQFNTACTDADFATGGGTATGTNTGDRGVGIDTIWDAKGDLAVGTGADTAIRLAPDTNGKVLSLNSATATGLEWIALAGGGDMVLAASQIVTGLKTFLDGTLGLRNVANTFTSLFTNTNTAARTYTLKDASGTLAFTSDIASAEAREVGIGLATRGRILF